MSAANLQQLFPQLQAAGFQITSPIDVSYNCVAFATADTSRWWDPNNPDGFWPIGVNRDDTVEGFVALFVSLGFEVCNDSALEDGFEKIAIYGYPTGAFAHVARQLANGIWTSKLGELEDITHTTLESLSGLHYGMVARFLRRPRVP